MTNDPRPGTTARDVREAIENGNLDKAISALNDLSQSDILSDGQPFSGANIDAPISSAGATQADIETGVDNSTTGNTISTNLDAKVSQVGGWVEWSSKITEEPSAVSTLAPGATNTINLVSGSGYVTNVEFIDGAKGDVDITGLVIDGTVFRGPKLTAYGTYEFGSFIPFQTSLGVQGTNNSTYDRNVTFGARVIL